MHELLLNAAVKDSDFETACAILQGLAWMTARRKVYRVSFFKGPAQPHPRGLRNLTAMTQTHHSRHMQQWSELSKHLSRSAYIMQLAHEVSVDTDLGGGTPVDLDKVPGTLRWTDVPDPLRDTPVTQRKAIEISEPVNLLTMMADNDYQFTTELIQETFTFIRGKIEYDFSRYYTAPLSGNPAGPIPSLPAWTDLQLIDKTDKWILRVKLNVMDDNHPENIKSASGELMKAKAEVEQLFDFKPVDRKTFDTRIAPPVTQSPDVPRQNFRGSMR